MPEWLWSKGVGGRRRWLGLGLWAALTSLAGLGGCVDKYAPDSVATAPNYLVVDGFVNLQGVTTVRLSRTRSLSTGAARPVEAGATLAIQDEGGTRYALTEQRPGTYASAALSLSAGRRYQLQLRTTAGRRYASDLVVGKLAPAIDSVSWVDEPTGVQVYVNTHDPAGATRYYRWNYFETWEFHARYQSDFEYVNGTFRRRTNNIYRCWQSDTLRSIRQVSTSQLSQDVVSKFPLRLLPSTSERLNVKYSILVQQVAQSLEEYSYWDQLRKNTESLGTLFDPLPSQISGNVHCLDDASERVLGYVGASSVAERRLFIDRTQLPLRRFLTGYEDCPRLDTVLVKDFSRFSNGYLPIYPVFSGSTLVGYAGSSPACADCRLRGTNVKPTFWP